MKSLHTIYTNFAKRLVMLLIILVTINVGNVLGAEQTATLDKTCFKSDASNYQDLTAL